MNEDILSDFLVKVAENPKILASHVSLFSALLCCKKNRVDCFNVSRKKVMNLSKIRSTATYHKCLKDLIQIGCVKYEPSFDPFKGSIIKL